MKREQVERQVTISGEWTGWRLDQVVAKLWPDFSRSTIHDWICDHSLRVNGMPSKPSYRIRGNEQVSVSALLREPLDWESQWEVPFTLLHEDEHLLIVDKPAGIVTHPGPGNETDTLVNGLIAHRPELARLPRAGIVHRLDRDTSGVMVVAGSAPACNLLTEMITRRELARRYVCILEGMLWQRTVVDFAIGRHSIHRTKQQIRADGKSARTEFTPIEQFRGHTFAFAILDTGRTHQIRVHASSLSLPIVGDKTYGARGRLPSTPLPALTEEIGKFSRQALHAKSLQFKHPITNIDLQFSSELPADMKLLLSVLRRDHVEFLHE